LLVGVANNRGKEESAVKVAEVLKDSGKTKIKELRVFLDDIL
jgi:hypothetical protein